MNLFELSSVLLVGYLLGSMPFSVWIARSNGVDLLAEGSGNPGATNVTRALGKSMGLLVLVLDAGKGFIASAWPTIGSIAPQTDPVLLSALGLLGALIGHGFSFFLNFRGGKSVATTIGGLLYLMPMGLWASLIVWGVVFYAFRYVSLASLAMGISLPFMALVFGYSSYHILLSLIIASFVVLKHRPNLVRLMNRSEHKFTKSSKDTK